MKVREFTLVVLILILAAIFFGGYSLLFSEWFQSNPDTNGFILVGAALLLWAVATRIWYVKYSRDYRDLF